MPAFLEKVADYILQHDTIAAHQFCIVLPNRRAGLFLQKHLQKKTASPIWMPEIFAIEDFMQEISGLQLADQAEQLFVLYSIYATEEGENAESFDLFCKWAPALLNDFNEIDNYLVDAKQLFSNLADIRSIENWSLGQPQVTEFQKQYMKFWSALGKWYFQFIQKLLDDGLATQGMAARRVWERVLQNNISTQYQHFIFAGFNALTKAEEQILSALKKMNRGTLLWDIDRYIFDNPAQEAGRFLRNYTSSLITNSSAEKYPFEHFEDRLSTEAKQINVVGVARNISQVKAAAHFLDVLPADEIQSPQTAVVLADEQLLLPMLHALPDAAKQVNITMGYPLRQTAVGDLCDALFQLHEYAKRLGIRSREGELKFYHRDLSRLFHHPWLRLLFADTKTFERLDNELIHRNRVFVSISQFQAATAFTEPERSFIHLLLKPWTTTTVAFDALQQIILVLRDYFILSADLQLDLDYLFRFSQIVNRMQLLTEKWTFMKDLRTLRSLMMQQINQAGLPFYGEPLEGLQIMGLLETRTLDFDTVILLSANENILPSGRSQHSFIVYDLRKAFGLPLWYERDAIFAYHFYHLLQRAKKITLIYNTEPDTFGSGERSRFVTQLLHELPERNHAIRIEEFLFDGGVKINTEPTPIQIEKSAEVIQQIHTLADSGLSPSALNSYRRCSLQFYFRYITGISEAEEIEEVIGADKLGIVIHATLEELYKDHCNQVLLPDTIKELQRKAPAVCEKLFMEICPPEELEHGKNLLTKRIALNYLQRFFDQEYKRVLQLHKSGIPFTVEALETELYAALQIDNRTIRLRGTADRIDKIGNTIQLIDYKTGYTADNELRFADWGEIRTSTTIEKSFQLLMYAFLYAREHDATTPLTSGIVSFRELNRGIKKVKTPDGEALTPAILQRFGNEMQLLLQDILNPDHKFSQTDDIERCRTCVFVSICGRE
jgi:hypothetical protein